mmetsp:Transcript_3998/g.13343  ORF Transcript_3998/g.13343 Transcript_3998/m.13343 type:complete len:303 (-) Transcript_3998:372-1280(-)
MFREYVQGVFRVVCSEVDVRDGLGDRVGRVREPRVEDEEARAGAERGDADAAAREDLLRLRVAVVAVAPREEAGQQAEEERVRDAARHREQRQEDVAAREREQERRREGPGRVERVVVLAVAADLLALAHGGADEGRRHGGHGEDGEGRRRRGPQVLGEPARRVDELARGRAAAATTRRRRRRGEALPLLLRRRGGGRVDQSLRLQGRPEVGPPRLPAPLAAHGARVPADAPHVPRRGPAAARLQRLQAALHVPAADAPRAHAVLHGRRDRELDRRGLRHRRGGGIHRGARRAAGFDAAIFT